MDINKEVNELLSDIRAATACVVDDTHPVLVGVLAEAAIVHRLNVWRAREARLRAGFDALWRYLHDSGVSFESWPDDVKDAVSAAIVDDTPLTPEQITWAQKITAALKENKRA